MRDEVVLIADIGARPQPNRIGLQQTQGASAQGGRAYDLAPLASDRSRRYRFHRTRMLQLFPTCRIRFYMTGIRSRSQSRETRWRFCTQLRFSRYGASAYCVWANRDKQ